MHTARHFWDLSIEDGLGRIAAASRKPPVRHNEDRPLYLYGKGNLGKLASDFLFAVERPPVAIFDQHDDVGDLDRRATVAVAVITSQYAPIERAIQERGFEHIVPFYDLAYEFRHEHPLGWNGWTADLLTADDRRGITEVWQRWADDRSRAHHLQFIAWRAIREEWTFAKAPVTNEDRYFIPEVVAALHDHEVFLDGGAYHGEVSRRFIEITRGQFKRIFAFEPDPKNCAGARSLWNLGNGDNILVYEVALASAEGKLSFYDGFGFASRIDPHGASTIQACKIDTIYIAPTFIKLHLEGGELDALKGARETLKRYRPVLAIATYHNSDGLYRTAEWLMETLPDYRFLFRNHCWQGAGAVVYAIPNERAR